MTNSSSATGSSPSATGLSPSTFSPLICVLGDDPAALSATLQALAGMPCPILLCGHGIETLPWPASCDVTLEALPTPLGRTIGRSWLVMHPRVRAAQWVVFLDAGLLPPRHWLDSLAQAVAAQPEARSWGCLAATDELLPGQVALPVQDALPSAAGLILDADRPPAPASLAALDAAAFALAPVPALVPDAGTCVRCLTMPGGCRLFRGDRLQEDGGWNLAFSPAWGADVERDLALALRHGQPACACQQALAIPAMAASAACLTPDARPDARPNAFKLAHRFSPGELETLATLSRSCHTALPGE